MPLLLCHSAIREARILQQEGELIRAAAQHALFGAAVEVRGDVIDFRNQYRADRQQHERERDFGHHERSRQPPASRSGRRAYAFAQDVIGSVRAAGNSCQSPVCDVRAYAAYWATAWAAPAWLFNAPALSLCSQVHDSSFRPK